MISRQVFSPKMLSKSLAALLGGILFAAAAQAEAAVLFRNVSVFDGKTNKLSANMNVLVEGETINHADRELWAGIVTFETAKSVSSSTSTRNVAYIYISTRESPYLLAYSSRPAVYPC